MPHRILKIASSAGVFWLAVPAAVAQKPVPKPLVPTPPPSKVEIPRDFRPPQGMCRVWIDKVPAGQQPAPTDCASAIRNRPPNARVIFSEDSLRRVRSRGRDSVQDGKAAARKPDRKPVKKPPEPPGS